jgi:F0F1-type ATP synthase assembly protein I
MIKTLLNADEEPPPGTKVIVEETVVDPPADPENTEPFESQDAPLETPETRPVFEIPETARFFARPAETTDEKPAPGEDPEPFTSALAEPLNGEPEIIKPAEPLAESVPLDEDSESEAALIAALENLEAEDLEFLERERESAPVRETVNEPVIEPPVERTEADKQTETAYENTHGTIFQSEYTPPTTGETIRQSGLAWSAGVVLFASVVFMMIFGWFADLLLGSSPWGLVGGVILGGIIGFIQLFRITSQIFRK